VPLERHRLTQHALDDAVPVARCQAFEQRVRLVDGTLGLDPDIALGVAHARSKGRRQVDERALDAAK